jgi:hypothetical protein
MCVDTCVDEGGKRMKVLRAILLGYLVMVVWAGISPGAEENEAVPIIEIENPAYDFQQIPQGEVVKHDFRVFNRGSAPLEIKSVKPG